jgi:predicted transcriptional regulator
MIVREVIDALELTVFSGAEHLDVEVTGGVISDILSDVMAQAQKGALWVTHQTHENVLAIVFFKSLSGIILPSGLSLEETAAKKAAEKNLPVLRSNLPAFQIVGKLWDLGIGRDE